MAIFSKKQNTEDAVETTVTETASPAVPVLAMRDIELRPRLSEKSVALNALNKFVFVVKKDANKIEIRKALEKFYNITIATVNIVSVQGKARRYGSTQGKTRNFKKAIVTLTKDSKKPAILEAK